jgi:hypothetical protein
MGVRSLIAHEQEMRAHRKQRHQVGVLKRTWCRMCCGACALCIYAGDSHWASGISACLYGQRFGVDAPIKLGKIQIQAGRTKESYVLAELSEAR